MFVFYDWPFHMYTLQKNSPVLFFLLIHSSIFSHFMGILSKLEIFKTDNWFSTRAEFYTSCTLRLEPTRVLAAVTKVNDLPPYTSSWNPITVSRRDTWRTSDNVTEKFVIYYRSGLTRTRLKTHYTARFSETSNASVVTPCSRVRLGSKVIYGQNFAVLRSPF